MNIQSFTGSFLVFFLIFIGSLNAQETPWISENYNGPDWIKSVKFHPMGLPTQLPCVTLQGQDRLLFRFDDLDGDVKDYTYQIVHCNEDWTKSDLNEFDYLDGFTDNYLEDFDFSINTLQPYTHYWLSLPNRDVRWTKSGNYLLLVFDDTDQRKLVIVRRFFVTEDRFRINARRVAPSRVEKQDTHHEIDFVVNHKDFGIRNARLSVTTTIMQNGRWDNALQGLTPVFIKGEDLIFDYQDKVIFPAGKEFRWMDLRTFRFRTDQVAEIIEKEDQWEVVLKPDKKRTFRPFITTNDLNGGYVIEHQRFQEPDLECDYGSVLFFLKSPAPIYDHDVYIFGELTDWQIKPEFRMHYNDLVSSYVGKPYLKQGFYDYLYVSVPHGTTDVILEETEGNRFETENGYYIMVYFRPFGSRYDRLMAFKYFNFRN